MNCRRCWGVDLRIASTLLMRNGSMTVRIVMLASLFAEIVERGLLLRLEPSCRPEHTTTEEAVNLTLQHEGNQVREFYSNLPRHVLVGTEAGGSMPWFPPRSLERLRDNSSLAVSVISPLSAVPHSSPSDPS